jgi:hypothetical protein
LELLSIKLQTAKITATQNEGEQNTKAGTGIHITGAKRYWTTKEEMED